MENQKMKVEDVLDKILTIDNLRDLDGHDDNAFQALLSYVMSCRKAQAKKITTKVMLAWDEQGIKEKAVLTEHYSKLQLVQLGMAIAMTEPLGVSMHAFPIPPEINDIIKKIFGRASEEDGGK